MTDAFTIEVRGEAAVQAALSDALGKLSAPGELLDRIGGRLVANVQGRFDTKRDPDGVPWLPLAASTRKAYEAKYDGSIPGSLLVRAQSGTGMRGTLTHNLAGSVLEVGFSDPKAAYHETGTRRGLPRRSMLAGDFVAGTLGGEDREDILAEISAYLGERL